MSPAAAACTDAERRAARAFQRRLIAGGRDAELETVWVRPQAGLSLLLHAGLGTAASLAAVAVPRVGAGVLLGVLVSWLLEATGRGRILSLLLHRRATQNVVSRAPERPYRLIVTAALDSGRGALIRRIPAVPVWLALALLGALGCAAARALGAGGAIVGAVQLVPTLALVLGCALALDLLVSSVTPGEEEAGAVAVALDLAAALDASPPRVLGVDLVLAGAGRPGSLGFRRHLRARRGQLDPATTAVLEVRASAAGAPRWWSHDGALLPIPAPEQLQRLAAKVASEEAALHARPRRGHERSAAYAARQRRLPALGVGGSPDATLELCLALVAALDDELSAERRTARSELATTGR